MSKDIKEELFEKWLKTIPGWIRLSASTIGKLRKAFEAGFDEAKDLE